MLLTVNSLQLDAPLNQTGECIVLIELILPRNGIARRSALKELSLKRGKRSLARAPFYEKALLKEKVDGVFGLKVSVSHPLKYPERNQFFRQLLATGIEGATDLISSSLIRHSLLSDLLDEAGEQFADRVDGDLSFIASGGVDLDSESLIPGKVKIPLVLTERIRSSQQVKLSEKREKRIAAAKTYRKGSSAGEIILDLIPAR